MKTSKLFFVMLLFTTTYSCKKETTTSNNPEIDDHVVNISIDSSGNSNSRLVDLNDDGSNDFNIFSSLPSLNKNNSDVGINGLSDFEFSTEAQSPVSNKIKVFAADASVNSATGTWNTLASFYFNLSGVSGYPVGINEQGDKFIGFRVMNDGGSLFYGWMLVNVTGGHKLSIKEYAIQTIANTAIKAGEK